MGTAYKMPLHWSIDSRTQLVTIVADGLVTRADWDAYVAAIEGAGAIGYRKLYDGRQGTPGMQPDDLLEIGAVFRSYHTQRVGAAAVVLPEDRLEAASRVIGILASADRPFRVFRTRHEAQKWLDSLQTGVG